MLRLLAFLAGLALLATLSWLALSHSRETPPALADAPLVRATAASTLETPGELAPTRALQSIETAQVSATTEKARVHGHLLFEDTRRPIAGARIDFRFFDPALLSKPVQELTASEREAQQKSLIVETDSDGSYSASFADGVLLSEARVLERRLTQSTGLPLVIHADAFVPTTRDMQLRALHGEVELDLFAGGGASLHGLVLQREDRKPVAGAEVTFEDGEGEAFSCTSAPDGQFTVRGITFDSRLKLIGRVTSLIVTHPDFVRLERLIPAPDADGHWADPTLLLDRGIVVGGIVVDARGEPVGGFELALRPLHGSAQGELCEFEGEWKTKSDATGIFLFPKIPSFDRAWLVTEAKPVEDRSFRGASRTLLHGKDPFLPSIELRLPLEIGVDVRALYPDGTQARSEDLLLLRDDDDGKLRSTGVKSRILCASGRATRIVAWCKPRAQDEEGVIYRGEAVVTTSSHDPDPHAEVQLARTNIQRKQLPPSNLQLQFGAGAWTNSSILLQLVDRANGLPLPETTLLKIEYRDAWNASQLGKDARLRLDCEPGWQTFKLTVEGYQAHTIELEVKDNEPQTLTLALDRVR